jgi:polyisoprenoid-binding protein YceI
MIIGNKMMSKQILMISTLITGLIFTGNWKPDTANAKINFTVEGIFGLVHGSFSGLQADIQFNEKDLSGSSFSASIDAKSVSTGISLRNSDLRNKEEWFNTDKFPRISLQSKKIEKTAAGYKALSDLTIKGITKAMEIPFTFTGNEETGIFKSQFTIQRTDFKLGKPGGTVGSVVTVILSIPVHAVNH